MNDGPTEQKKRSNARLIYERGSLVPGDRCEYAKGTLACSPACLNLACLAKSGATLIWVCLLLGERELAYFLLRCDLTFGFRLKTKGEWNFWIMRLNTVRSKLCYELRLSTCLISFRYLVGQKLVNYEHGKRPTKVPTKAMADTGWIIHLLEVFTVRTESRIAPIRQQSHNTGYFISIA